MALMARPKARREPRGHQRVAGAARSARGHGGAAPDGCLARSAGPAGLQDATGVATVSIRSVERTAAAAPREVEPTRCRGLRAADLADAEAVRTVRGRPTTGTRRRLPADPLEIQAMATGALPQAEIAQRELYAVLRVQPPRAPHRQAAAQPVRDGSAGERIPARAAAAPCPGRGALKRAARRARAAEQLHGRQRAWTTLRDELQSLCRRAAASAASDDGAAVEAYRQLGVRRRPWMRRRAALADHVRRRLLCVAARARPHRRRVRGASCGARLALQRPLGTASAAATGPRRDGMRAVYRRERCEGVRHSDHVSVAAGLLHRRGDG